MLEAEGICLGQGMTFGLADILQAEKISMLIAGKEKRDVLDQFLESSISTRFPASFLHLHPHVHVIIDESITLLSAK